MKKNEYLMMLFQDNETETEPKKELHEAVLECAVEALSQTDDNFEIDGKIGLSELYAEIQKEGKNSKAYCVSPFHASELIAAKLGTTYSRPINKLRAQFGSTAARPAPKVNFDDFI